MKRIVVSRPVCIPDALRIARCQRAPDLGPRLLFFSGGTALNEISRELKAYTHNSIHLVTPFDSGGSSAKLRDAFAMPAIGDLRTRLMALADESVLGHPEIFRLFNYRFPMDKRNGSLVKALEAMVEGKDSKVTSIRNPMRRLICNNLGFFRDAMPRGFDLRGASIGNLILAGGYLNNHEKLDPIVFLFSRLVGVRGTARTILNDDLHLAAELENGRTIVGQHRMTGKEVAPIRSPIRRLFISRRADKPAEVHPAIQKKKRRLIDEAELVCFPPGSFYSSLIANLLPRGVGTAVAANPAPKVYLPSLGNDPETLGMSVADGVRVLIDTLRHDSGEENPLDFVMLDGNGADYGAELSRRNIRRLGVTIIDTPLVHPGRPTLYDPKLVSAALLSLA